MKPMFEERISDKIMRPTFDEWLSDNGYSVENKYQRFYDSYGDAMTCSLSEYKEQCYHEAMESLDKVVTVIDEFDEVKNERYTKRDYLQESH